MKTRERQLFRRLGRGAFGLQVVMLLLVMLTGASPAWAYDWDTEKNLTDEGGGTYTYRAEKQRNFSNDAGYFKTLQAFNFDQDKLYWDFEFCCTPEDGYLETIEGEVCVITSDNQSHKIATWKKERSSDTNDVNIEYKITDNTWGYAHVSNIYVKSNRRLIHMQFLPTSRGIVDGVKCLVFRHHITYYIIGFSKNWGWFQFEKDIDLSSAISAEKPMPLPTVEWGDDGKLAFKATGVPDKRGNSKVGSQGYVVDLNYYENGEKSSTGNGFTTGMNNLTYSNEKNGKMDVAFSCWPLTTSEAYAKAAYTVPVYVDYYAYVRLNEEKKDGITIVPNRHVLDQPKVEGVLIEPFTRPIDMTVDFDRWGKKNTVKWQRQKKAKGYDGTKEVEVNCRYKEGKWHVLRYLKGQAPSTYKEVGTPLAGDATKLEVVDQDFDYDKEYMYRVVYLPTILESKFGSKMTQLPGHSNSTKATAYDLWDEVEKNTELGLHIKLTQDVTDTEKVKLKWQYSIPVSGMTWYVEYKDPTEKTWHESTETYPVDPDLTEASASFAGSVCEPVTYRIKTKVGNTFVYSDTLTARLSTGSYIKNVKATTGTHEQTVDVTWDVENADPTNEIMYVVKRRPIGTEEWTLVSDSIPSKERSQKWTDTRPQTGTYYEYTVEAYGAKCAEQVEKAKMDGIVTPGFSQARGTITGHIAFGSGTAVQGVRVNLVKSSADQESDQVQYLSRYIEGAGKGLLWTADSANYAAVFTGQKPATLQLWAKPSGDGSDQMALATLTNALQLEVKKGSGATYYLSVVDLSSGDPTKYKVTEFPNLTFSDHDFTHISAVYDGAGKWKFYVGTDSLLTDSITVANTNWKAIPAAGTNTLAVGGSNQAVNALYKGHVDDIRLWARALKPAEVESNYTRILGGTEDGLRLYWPLDEGELVRQYAFDIACQDGMYQLNHPEVGPNAVPRKEVPKHLKLYGVTDKEGDYIIKGIPFQQGGTNYKVTPLMGAHEFSPGTRSMFISPTSLTANNIDFEDVSSFPMQGYVYYVGTNIPVEGVMIKVDGMPQSKDGELIVTDATGHYEVSVPIGEHFVEAYLDNHTMVAGGRYPRTGKDKFIGAVRYDFADSTLVNFVGRVAGGERNDTLGVGFGNNERIVGRPSKNNIGVATIALKLNSDKLSFNRKTGTPETYPTFRPWESDTTSINSHSFTGTATDAKFSDKRIYIQTDSVTGEFSALLPPLKYTVQSIKIESNDQIEFTELPEIDLSIAGSTRTDSVRMAKEGSTDTTWVKYEYHTKMVKTYYAPPQLNVVDTGADPGFFGLKKITFPGQEEGDPDIVIDDLYKEGRTPRYLVDYPIYKTGQKNVYSLFGYEVYENCDVAGKVETDTIALPHVDVTVANEMSSEQKIVYEVMDESTGYKPGQPYEVTAKQIPLDDNGKAELKWMTGYPNITAPYTRKFSVAMERKGRTYNVANIDAVVLGELTDGNNFVTKGPDKVDFVLRDPQGAKSTTKLITGRIVTKTFYDTRRAYGEYSAIFSSHIGTETSFGTGIGLIVMSDLSAVSEVDFGAKTSWEKTWNEDSVYVETRVENVSTSGSKPYVGASGDVYIGKSLNWLIGTCRRLFITYNEEKEKYELKLEDAISVGDTISTAFKYTQYELENVMIPKWKDMRREFLTEVATEEEARSYVNNGTSPVYLTWKGLNEQSYVVDKNYVWVKPESWNTKPPTKLPEDSVAWCNSQIIAWENTIMANEEDKVRLMKEGKKKENISIDGGSSYSYSSRTADTKHHETTVDWKMGVVLNGKIAFANQSFLNIGHSISVTTEDGGGFIRGDGTITENYTEWEYNIEDGNRDTDLSLTIYHSDNSKYSDFFSVFGGQTYNPYQDQEWTHYYTDPVTGKHVALGNATEQMEQPDMRIGLPGENTAKSVNVTDIPAGGEATVMLQCTNLGHSNQGVDFSYDVLVLDETNNSGLQILMDGVPINGRSLYLEHDQTVSKVLTIRQTDQSILDYEGIKLWFASQYQPAKIHDEVVLNAHFVPSSSPVVLAIDEPVVNCNTDSAKLEMKVKDFNRQFKNLKNVGVQYRFAGNTQWTNLYTWWVHEEDTVGLDTLSNTLMKPTGDLKLKVKMENDLSYPEGNYEFRAFTTTPYGSEMVHRYSDVVNVIKDRTRPVNLYTPAPANGILGYGDQLSIEFNEDIVPGYVGADNVIVTAKLNQEAVKHDVSLALHPFGEQPVTVNPVFLNGDFAVEFWLKWENSGTILHQGPSNDNFALGINSEGRVTVTIAKNEFVSTAPPLPKDEWIFFALNYNQATRSFNAMASYGTSNIMVFTNEKVSTENVQAVTSTSDNRLYLGEIDGNIHSLALYNICRNLNEAASEKYVVKDNYVYGLANFWPMDEGHGFTAADSRHTHDFSTPERWTLANENYSLRINDGKGAEADISQIGTGRGDSYAIELWYSRSTDKDEVVFETATPTLEGDQLKTKLKLHFNDSRDLVLDYGTKSQIVASHEDFDFTSWHHYALNVVRGQAASFYLDGKRTAVIPEADMVPIEGSRLIVGKNATLAFADELRIWHAALSESRLLQSIYNTLDTASIYSRGLVAYYPFEKRHEENGNVSKVETLDNMAPNAAAKAMICNNFQETDLVKNAPPLKNAPDERQLIVTPIASERKVVVNLTGTDLTPRKLEGTTLNITVDKIHDLHGNESRPIRWTAYMQQNTLKWTRDSVNIFKQYGDDYTFDVNIENKSGSTELYTLYNMPQWLTLVDSERTDDVQPLKTKTLRFEVNPLVPVGNYEVTIGLQGNNGILEPLRIVMKVRGEKPQWAVDPTKYDHQMNIIGQVYINGILTENPESMVAAFIDGECRGVASPEKIRGAAYVAMTVYGIDDRRYDMGKPVTFRLWDASQGVAYTDAQIAVNGSPVNVTFGQDKMLGNFDTPAIWTKSENVEQLIPIHQNWNWIAFGVEPQSTYLDHVFGAYAEWSMLIKNRNQWNDYNGAQWGGGELKSVKANEMYKLKIDRLPTTMQDTPNSLLTVSGRQLKEKTVTLTKGWNWIAYTPLTTMTVDEALAGANPQKGDIVKSQTGVSIYGDYGWEGSLKALESGRGYLYCNNADEEKSFVYPTVTTALARAQNFSAPRRAPDDLCIFNPVPQGLYPSNMTMAIQLRDRDAVVDTAEVAAFIDDECRGATRASDNGLYYIVISGDGAGQSITLRTCIDGEIIDIDNTQMYVSDANIGTSWEPYVIYLKNLPDGIRSISIDDADDGDWYTLLGFKIGRKPTQPGVYIHHGQKITIKREK